MLFLPIGTDLETHEGWGGGEHPLKQKLSPLSVVVLCIIIGMEQFYVHAKLEAWSNAFFFCLQ